MHALTVHAPDDYRLDPFMIPKPGPRDAVLKIEACGICGSDLSYIRWGTAGAFAVSPMPLGHEAAGTIAALGKDVEGLAFGEHVILNPITKSGVIGNGAGEGAFAPYLLVRDVTAGATLHAMPPGMDFETAALAEPLAVARHAVNRGQVTKGERAVVFGAGPIGLGIMLWLRHYGLTDVVAVDPSPERLALAGALGATELIRSGAEDVFARLKQLHGERAVIGRGATGTDVFFDAAGAPGIIPQVIDMAQLSARLIVVAVYGKSVFVDLAAALRCELSIILSMGYPEEFGAVVKDLPAVAATATRMITDRYPFADVMDAFNRAFQPGAGKIMVSKF